MTNGPRSEHALADGREFAATSASYCMIAAGCGIRLGFAVGTSRSLAPKPSARILADLRTEFGSACRAFQCRS